MIRKRLALIAGLVLFVSTVQAQPNPGEDPDVPIDGGVGLLLAAGISYGAKKLYDQKKLEKES